MEKKEDTKQRRELSGVICGIFLDGFQINTEKKIKKEKDCGKDFITIIVSNKNNFANYLQ
jgi:hypothetical protein